MIRDLDIYRSANVLIREYGEAAIHAWHVLYPTNPPNPPIHPHTQSGGLPEYH